MIPESFIECVDINTANLNPCQQEAMVRAFCEEKEGCAHMRH